MLSIVAVLLVAVLGFAAYVWTSLHYVYSSGDRAGFIQKFSKKGWICKTWEGEIAMTALPGATPGCKGHGSKIRRAGGWYT